MSALAEQDRNCVLMIPSQRTHQRVRLPVISLPFEWHEDRRVPCQDAVVDLGLDRCGRRRSRATDPMFRKGVKPANAGLKYYPSPYTEDQVLAFMAACPDTRPYRRLRALVCVLWRSGLRISEALDLRPEDFDERAGSVLVRCGKGGKRGISGMDQFGFDALNEWMVERVELPPGPVFCIACGPTAGQRWTPAGVRQAMARVKRLGGFSERWAPHQLRHSLAVSLAKEGVLLPLISKQLRHSNIATTSTYLSGISPQDVIDAISARPVPSSAGRGVARHDQEISTPGGCERPERAQGPEVSGGESGVPTGPQEFLSPEDLWRRDGDSPGWDAEVHPFLVEQA